MWRKGASCGYIDQIPSYFNRERDQELLPGFDQHIRGPFFSSQLDVTSFFCRPFFCLDSEVKMKECSFCENPGNLGKFMDDMKVTG